MAQVAPTFDTAHAGAIHDAQLDYYGKFLASSSADHTIHVWDVSSDTPQFVSELKGHEGPVWQVSWAHPKYGNLLGSCSYDRKVIIWREQPPKSWNPIYISDEHLSSVDAIQFSPWEFGLRLACGSSDGTVSILSYNPELGSWSRKAFPAHRNGVLGISWCPAAPDTTVASAVPSNPAPQTVATKRIVTGGCDHQIRIWNYVASTNEWIEAHQMADQGHERWVRDVAWRPNPGLSPALIASCSDDGSVILWQETDCSSWKNKQVIHMKEPVWKVSWSVTGAVLAVASGSTTVSLFKENLQGLWEPLSSATAAIVPSETSTETIQAQQIMPGDSIPPTPPVGEYLLSEGPIEQENFPYEVQSGGGFQYIPQQEQQRGFQTQRQPSLSQHAPPPMMQQRMAPPMQQRPLVSALHAPPASAMHPPPASAMHPPPASAMHPPPASAMHPPPASAMHPPPASAMHPPPASAMHPPPTGPSPAQRGPPIAPPSMQHGQQPPLASVSTNQQQQPSTYGQFNQNSYQQYSY